MQEEKWENQFTIGMVADFKGILARDVAEQKEISLPQEEKKWKKKDFTVGRGANWKKLSLLQGDYQRIKKKSVCSREKRNDWQEISLLVQGGGKGALNKRE